MARPAKSIAIRQIAEEAGVSVPTVSRVINRKSGIAEATRERVNRVLTRYNFKPDPFSARITKIAVLYPWAELSDYFRNVMQGIYSYSQDNDLTINIIIVNEYLKPSLLKAVRDQQCSGVIALIPSSYPRQLSTLCGTDLPVVVVDNAIHDRSMGFIDNDSSSGSIQAANHLLDLGHKKIGYLCYPDPVLNHLQRFKAYENTLLDRGIEVQPNWVVRFDAKETCISRSENGYEAMKILLKNAPEITAVMAVDDTMALGALAAMHEAGIRVPEDISIVGFDNYPQTAFWNPPLTTVDHPLGKAGRQAIEAVHKGLSNPGKWTPPQDILSTSLVIRKSTGPARC